MIEDSVAVATISTMAERLKQLTEQRIVVKRVQIVAFWRERPAREVEAAVDGDPQWVGHIDSFDQFDEAVNDLLSRGHDSLSIPRPTAALAGPTSLVGPRPGGRGPAVDADGAGPSIAAITVRTIGQPGPQARACLSSATMQIWVHEPFSTSLPTSMSTCWDPVMNGNRSTTYSTHQEFIMSEPTTTIGALVAKRVGTVAVKKMVEQIRHHDIGKRAEQFFADLGKRLLGIEDYHGLEPGLLTQLTLATSKIDDDQLRDYWVALAFNGMTSTITDSEMRWASLVMERLVPMDTVALALCLDKRVRMRRTGVTRMPVVDAMNRLRVHGLVEMEAYSGDGMTMRAPSFASITKDYKYREGHSPGLVEKIAWGSAGPGRKEEHVSVVQRWVITDLGAKFAHFCDVKQLDVHGEFEGMVVRMDAAFFASL